MCTERLWKQQEGRQRDSKVQPVHWVDPADTVPCKPEHLLHPPESTPGHQHHHKTADDKEQVDAGGTQFEPAGQKCRWPDVSIRHFVAVKTHHAQRCSAPQRLDGIDPAFRRTHADTFHTG